MNFSAVLFDLDGTLLDTLDDLADSMNAVLSRMGFPAHPVNAYRYFVGDGVSNLATRALPEEIKDEGTIKTCVRLMADEYEKRWADKTKPYDGVIETLGKLKEKGLLFAILSNKNDDFTRKAVERFLPSHLFSVIRGHKKGRALKPDPSEALVIADEIGISPERFLYLGDTATDMKTALACGMCPVGVLWGFRNEEELVSNGARHIIEEPYKLLDLN